MNSSEPPQEFKRSNTEPNQTEPSERRIDDMWMSACVAVCGVCAEFEEYELVEQTRPIIQQKQRK